jgi:Glutaminase
VAELVQRYLDQIRAEHAGVIEGAVADYIPELARVDPAGFGLSLSLSDGYIYDPATRQPNSPFSRYRNRSPTRSHSTRSVRGQSTPESVSSPPARRST